MAATAVPSIKLTWRMEMIPWELRVRQQVRLGSAQTRKGAHAPLNPQT
jgi:hypothetical protein